MFNVGKFDACIGAVDISCRKGNRNRTDSSSGLVDEFCVVETADSVFGLGGNSVILAKFHDMVIKFHIIKSSVITEGNNRAFALSADKFFARNTGNVAGGGCFNNYGNIRIDGECGVSGAVSANFLTGGEADSHIIFGIFLEKLHKKGTACSVINSLCLEGIFGKLFICVQNTLAATLLVIACCLEADMMVRANEPMGFNNKDIGIIYGNGERYDAALLSTPYVKSIGKASSQIQAGFWEWLRASDGELIEADVFLCDTTAFRIMDFQVKQDFNTDLIKSVWISERLMNNLGLSYEDVQNGPAGSIFAITGRSDYHFGGIIEDFRLVARKTEAPDPGRLVVITPDTQGLIYNIMELSGNRKEVKKALIDLNTKLAMEEPGSIIYGIPENCVYPEEFRDVAMFEQNRMMKTVRLFTIISILISILGMLGMSSYYANENTKSIAVHKIHGGTVRSETLRNIRTYMFLTATACLLGTPLGLHVMKTYMTEYSFMDISYALPTAIAVTLTVCTSLLAVLWQTLRAARTNPVEALKKE